MRNRETEVLAPAGSYECLEAAVQAGADAVYLGGRQFGARAFAANFDREDLLRALEYVHLRGRKLYLTVNTLLKGRETEELEEYLMPFYREGLDAVIVQDLGVLDLVRERFPDLAVHISTQMTVTSEAGARFFKDKGATRIVPARELSLEEIRRMKEKSGLEMECFPGTVRPALPAALPGRRRKAAGHPEYEGSVRPFPDPGADRGRSGFL